MLQSRSGIVIGLVSGALVALVFAIVISQLPERLFTDDWLRVLAFAVVATAAPPSVWLTWAIASLSHQNRKLIFDWVAVGAMTFDGVMIGFRPSLYGQTGSALASAAAMLLFAFASLLVAGLIMNRLARAGLDQARRT